MWRGRLGCLCEEARWLHNHGRRFVSRSQSVDYLLALTPIPTCDLPAFLGGRARHQRNLASSQNASSALPMASKGNSHIQRRVRVFSKASNAMCSTRRPPTPPAPASHPPHTLAASPGPRHAQTSRESGRDAAGKRRPPRRLYAAASRPRSLPGPIPLAALRASASRRSPSQRPPGHRGSHGGRWQSGGLPLPGACVERP